MMESHCKICDPKCKFSDCICNKNFSQFYDIYNYISNIDYVDDIKLLKKWSISTMTICCSFNCNIQLENYISEYIPDISRLKFYNCINTYISTKYQRKSRVSIKIFKNGNIQIAGILNVTAACYCIRKLFKRINNIEAFTGETPPFISNVRICMINSDFKIDKNIKQAMFCKEIDSDNYDFIRRYSFNPTKYPGINIKVKTDCKDLTCAIFRPGSIIITGGNDVSYYKKIFQDIFIILKNNKNLLY
jgi:TATA-box binding protein (TBP) (component of TFIID and TFIIIB)